MPIYEYSCTACGRRTEAKQSFTDPALQECEVCGGKLRKLFSPVGIVFKGSGFYSTDAKKKSSTSSNTSGSDSGSDSGSKSEAEPGSKAESGSGSKAASGVGSGAKASGNSHKGPNKETSKTGEKPS